MIYIRFSVDVRSTSDSVFPWAVFVNSNFAVLLLFGSLFPGYVYKSAKSSQCLLSVQYLAIDLPPN